MSGTAKKEREAKELHWGGRQIRVGVPVKGAMGKCGTQRLGEFMGEREAEGLKRKLMFLRAKRRSSSSLTTSPPVTCTSLLTVACENLGGRNEKEGKLTW